jgi:hypothetical protein
MAVAPSILLVVEIIAVACFYWLANILFNFFANMAQLNGWGAETTGVIIWTWKLLPLILIFGVIIGHFLFVARKDSLTLNRCFYGGGD